MPLHNSGPLEGEKPREAQLFEKKSANPASQNKNFSWSISLRCISRVTLAIFTGYAAVCLCIVYFVEKAIGDAEESIVRNAQTRAAVIAKSYANYLAERTDLANIVAKSVVYQFHVSNGRVDLGQLVAAGLISSSSQRLVTLVDAQGVAFQAWPTPIGEAVYYGDREHITNQLNTGADNLYIGAPVIGRVSNVLTLQFTRKLFNRDGRVVGVVVVSEPINFYTKSFANQTNLGADGQLLAFRTDGRLLVRVSPNGQATSSGRSLDEYPLGKPRDAFARDPIDQRPRLYVRESVPGYPITAVVALSKQDIYGDYERRKQIYWQWTALLASVLFVMAFIVKSHIQTLRRQRSWNAKIAETDPLTGLGNRRALDKCTLRRSVSDRQFSAALVLFEIYDFSDIVGRYGDDVRDGFLKMVANRLSLLGKSAELVARIKADQFAVFFWGDDPRNHAVEFVRELFDSTRFPVHFRGYSRNIRLSVGIGASECNDTAGSLRGQASYALDLAKQATAVTRQNEYRVYDGAMFKRFGDERLLEEALRDAVIRENVEAEFLPIRDVRTESICAFWAEPLLRRSTEIVLRAGDFMAAADRCRLSGSVWMRTIMYAAHNLPNLPEGAGLYVRVPVEFVREIDLDDFKFSSEFPPNRLKLALVGLLLSPLDDLLIERSTALRELGISIYAVVDVDSGISFEMVSNLPLDGIVLEGSWINAIPASPIATAVVAGLLAAAEQIRLPTIVSGVSDIEQMSWLRSRFASMVSGSYVESGELLGSKSG
ncbi:TPA: diguanylate cyclase domain-containing protein [Burkholderia orbicola]|nr:diguanylate cyclase [Burkholderia cenocepacia]